MFSLNPTAGNNNGLTGGVSVSGTGTVVELRGNNLGGSSAGTGALTIEAGAIVRVFSHNTLGNGSGTALSPLVINGGTFEADAYNHVNSITMSGGKLGVRSGVTQVDGMDMKFRVVNPTVTTLANAATATISSIMSVGVPLTITTADGAAATDLLVSGGVIGGSSVTKEGPGTLVFSTQKTYSGGTVVNAGVDLTGGGGTGGTIRGTATVNTGATLRMTAQDVTGYGTGVDRLHTINVNGGTLHNNNAINMTLVIQRGDQPHRRRHHRHRQQQPGLFSGLIRSQLPGLGQHFHGQRDQGLHPPGQRARHRRGRRRGRG